MAYVEYFWILHNFLSSGFNTETYSLPRKMLGSVKTKGNLSSTQIQKSNEGKLENSQKCSNINVPVENLKYHSQFGELDSNL